MHTSGNINLGISFKILPHTIYLNETKKVRISLGDKVMLSGEGFTSTLFAVKVVSCICAI